MTYSLKAVLNFTLAAILIFTSMLLGVDLSTLQGTFNSFALFIGFIGLSFATAGWYRVFDYRLSKADPEDPDQGRFFPNLPPRAVFWIVYAIGTVFGLGFPFLYDYVAVPVVIKYITSTIGLAALSNFFALAVRSEVEKFEEQQDVILNTPLTDNVTPKNLKDYIKDNPEEGFEDKLTPKYEGNVFTPQIDTLILKPDTYWLGDIAPGKKVVMFFVPKNLKATDLEVDQYISFIHNDETGQCHIQGTVTYVARDDFNDDANPDFGKIIFELNNHPYTYVAESDDEVFRHMGQLEDVTEPTDPVWAEMLRSDYSPSFEATATKAKAETIEKMLEDAVATDRTFPEETETFAESYLPKPRTTLPADPFTDILEEALTGPLPKAALDPEYKEPTIHIDPTDPKWKGTLTPEEKTDA